MFKQIRSHAPRVWAAITLLTLGAAGWAGAAQAQGQDSTPAERNLLILAELLPGQWNNANQAYFDRRRGLPEPDRHARVHATIESIEAPAFGPHVFLWTQETTQGEASSVGRRIASLHLGESADVVVMRHWFDTGDVLAQPDLSGVQPSDLQRTEGCDYEFRRRAGQFRGQQKKDACRFQWQGEAVHTNNTIELSPEGLWFFDHKVSDKTGERLTGVGSGEPYWLERAREFHCYADLPGVGGGRDEPFERYENIVLHDKGDIHWFDTREAEPRRIGLMLQSVTWHILNEKDSGNFNRNSMVIYTMEQLDDGTVKEHGYAFTEPQAERIGINLKWMLVNCSMTPRDQARPAL